MGGHLIFTAQHIGFYDYDFAVNIVRVRYGRAIFYCQRKEIILYSCTLQIVLMRLLCLFSHSLSKYLHYLSVGFTYKTIAV